MPPPLQNRPSHSSRPSISNNQSSSHPFSPSAVTTASSQGGYSYSQYGYNNSSPGLAPGQPNNSSQQQQQHQQQQQPTRSGSSNNLASQVPQRQVSGSRPLLQQQGRNVSGASTSTSNQGNGAIAQEKFDQAREIARIHFRALKSFLWTWLQNESPTSRASAREKLTRLTRSQFQELSTDVYDELVRRRDSDDGKSTEAPFLPVREDFHPKRNQARQKLATLPKNRFKDLGSDVFYELRRRWPEFEEEMQPPVTSPTSAYPQTANTVQDRPSSRAEQPSTYQAQPGSRDQLNSEPKAQANNSQPERLVPGPARRPSQMDRAPGLASSDSHNGLTTLSASTTNDNVVPNKSTMTEERIEVPYAQEGRDSVILGGDSGSDSENERETERNQSRDRDRGHERQSSRASSNLSRTGTKLINRSSSRLGGSGGGKYSGQQDMEDLEDEESTPDHANRPSAVQENGDRGVNYSRTRADTLSERPGTSLNNRPPSAASQHTATAPAGSGATANAMVDLLRERKARSDVEAKLAGLERRLAATEKEAKEASEREAWERSRARELEEEVRGHKEKSASHSNELWSMQRELDTVRTQADSDKQRQEDGRRSIETEIAQWKERYNQLNAEKEELKQQLTRNNRSMNENDSAEAIKELQNELIILLEELKAVSARNEELIAEKDEDAERIDRLEADVTDYRRKWETTRTQLRNLKATSTMFVSKPITDDHMPASLDGNIADVHVTAFQSAIDNLLAIARSSQPTGVLQAMKGVVESINDISEDVRQWEADPNFTIDQNQLDECKHQSSATLNALMQAARSHAMSSGLSPISLLDAAASHVSSNVVEIIKLLKIRRTVRPSTSVNSLSRKSFSEMQARRSISAGSGAMGKLEVIKDGKASAPTSPGGGMLSPVQHQFNGGPLSPALRSVRADSVVSSSSAGHQSDAFDLDRKASMVGNRHNLPNGTDYAYNNHPQRLQIDTSYDRPTSRQSGYDNPSQNQYIDIASPVSAYNHQNRTIDVRSISPTQSPVPEPEQSVESRPKRNSGDWEEVKPYLSTQSSALVNSIQQLLAEIRHGNNANSSAASTSALNDHLSEVIAIGSSIVAVASGVLPTEADGPEGAEAQRLLEELMHSTDKLSTHQSATEFTKPARQEIASAAFGMAKALRGLMKVQ